MPVSGNSSPNTPLFSSFTLASKLSLPTKICCFLLVFCSCFVPPFCYRFAPVMLQNRHPFGTVLVLFSVTLLGVSCEPLERVMDGFPPPHISRLPLGFSWVPLGLNAPHSLCSSFVRFKLHHHQNHIKTSSKIACILLAF